MNISKKMHKCHNCAIDSEKLYVFMLYVICCVLCAGEPPHTRQAFGDQIHQPDPGQIQAWIQATTCVAWQPPTPYISCATGVWESHHHTTDTMLSGRSVIPTRCVLSFEFSVGESAQRSTHNLFSRRQVTAPRTKA